jgi:glycosyltransferase involved in cell wall biosynthesis
MKYNEKYDFSIVITTYEREEMLKKLLDDIFEYKNYKILVTIFDDGSKESYDLSNYDVKYIKYIKNNGLKNVWSVITETFKYSKKINADYYFYLQDDLRLKDNFFEESVRIFEKIDDDKKICLELRTDQRTTRPNWTRIEPKIIDEYIHTQWVELDFMCKYDFFEALNFEINPIPKDRWDKDPNLSCGVGDQMSNRLLKLGYNMYHVKNSLTIHGDHESMFLPELRKNEKLIAL